MFLLKKLLSAWLLPPLGLLVVALLFLIFGNGRFSRFGAGVAIATVLAMALPLTANRLTETLEPSEAGPAALGNAQAIVILGGGVRYGALEYGGDTLSKASLERVRYGARLARMSKLPVLVSGGSVFGGVAEAKLMKQALEEEFDVPVRWTEADSRDTQENAYFSARQLKGSGIQRIALVTQAWHMHRAVASFERQGLSVIPAPMDFASQGAALYERLMPSATAFERSTNVIHEWVGLALLSE